MSKEEIAIELTKAWCMQPSTAQKCFQFTEVTNHYKEALEMINVEEEKQENEKIKMLEDRINNAISMLEGIESTMWNIGCQHEMYKVQRVRCMLTGNDD